MAAALDGLAGWAVALRWVTTTYNSVELQLQLRLHGTPLAHPLTLPSSPFLSLNLGPGGGEMVLLIGR
jgi:hypothetical protein